MAIVIFKHGKSHFHIFSKIISCLPIDRPDLDFWTFHQSLLQNAAVFRNGKHRIIQCNSPFLWLFRSLFLSVETKSSVFPPSLTLRPLKQHWALPLLLPQFCPQHFSRVELGRNGAFYFSLSCFGAFTTFFGLYTRLYWAGYMFRVFMLVVLLLLLSTCWQSSPWCSPADCRWWTTTPAGTMPVSGTTGTAIPLRATRSADSRHRDWISHLPVPSPPAGCQHIGESENAGQTLAGERTSTNILNISRILGPRQQYSPTYRRKRQLQTVWSSFHSLVLVGEEIGPPQAFSIFQLL